MATPLQQVIGSLTTPAGRLAPGNIDLMRRPVVRNPKGGTSTVYSMSFEEDGREILIPRVSDDGRILTVREAIDEYRRTGKHLGIFKDVKSATAYAQDLHHAFEAGWFRNIGATPIMRGGIFYSRGR